MRKSVLSFFQKLRLEGSFVRNVSIASSWNVAVIISQLVLSPVTTRLYDPTQYGTYALFNSIVVNIALFSTLKYSDTIVLAETNEQRNNLISLSFFLILVVTALSGILVISFKDILHSFLDAQFGETYLLLVPLGVLFTGSLEILLILNIRRKKFFNNGFAGFLNGTVARCFNIFYALGFRPNVIGLISGDFLGKLLSIGSILYSFKNLLASLSIFFKTVTIKGVRRIAFKYKAFPLYFLPSSMLIYLSGHLPLYFFQFQFGSTIVGIFALSTSMLEIFNRLIPYALSPVFLQKANELKKVSVHHLAVNVYRLFLYMILLAIVIFSGFILFSQIAFPLIFGQSWVKAGPFAAILALQYAFNFVAVALSELYNVLGRQRFLFVNSVLNVVLKIIAIALIFYAEVTELNAILIYSLVSSIGGISLILGVFIILNHHVWKVFSWLFLCMILLLMLLFFKGLLI